MKIAGIIAEYNPFHNGHKYQLDEVKKNGNAAVVIMSGSFVQRGDIAVYDKYTRARCAVLCGADLVIELPCVYSLSTAQRFARGAVATLDALGVAHELCFGAEYADTAALIHAANLLDNEPPEVSSAIKRLTTEGMVYPAARQRAFADVIDAELLSKPNNILAIEYIRALGAIKSSITPSAVQRVGTGHHDTAANGSFASASAIRAMMNNGDDIHALIPNDVYGIYASAAVSDRERLFPMLYHTVRRLGADGIRNAAGISEGLENRIYNALAFAGSFSELASAVKTKRYTMTRIDRALMCVLLGITDGLTALPPQYIRVLALNGTGADILSRAKSVCRLPIITKPAAFTEVSPIWERELFAGDIAAAAFGTYGYGSELRRSPIYVERYSKRNK